MRDSSAAAPVAGRARPLLNSRALTGGLMLASAATIAFVAAQPPRPDAGHPFLFAARDLPAGTALQPGDVEVVRVDLPDALAPRAFADPTDVVGAVVVAPLAAGDLLQASAVVDPTGAGSTREVSLSLEIDRLVGGRLQPGEFVDAFSTTGTGDQAQTQAVVRRARVVAVDRDDGVAGRTVVTLAVTDDREAHDLVHALRAGEVTLVRTTFASG